MSIRLGQGLIADHLRPSRRRAFAVMRSSEFLRQLGEPENRCKRHEGVRLVGYLIPRLPHPRSCLWNGPPLTTRR